jgi:pimeloyl-ACP methyl ester carboxylesterase
VPKINVPALVIHGDNDQTVPMKISSDRTAAMLGDAEYIVYKGAPHGLYFTDKERLNADLLKFINK